MQGSGVQRLEDQHVERARKQLARRCRPGSHKLIRYSRYGQSSQKLPRRLRGAGMPATRKTVPAPAGLMEPLPLLRCAALRRGRSIWITGQSNVGGSALAALSRRAPPTQRSNKHEAMFWCRSVRCRTRMGDGRAGAGQHHRRHRRHGARQHRCAGAGCNRQPVGRGHRHEEDGRHERERRVRVSRSELRLVSGHRQAAGLPVRGLQQGHRRSRSHDGHSRSPDGRRRRARTSRSRARRRSSRCHPTSFPAR